jgi:hypothetical protein
MAATATDLRTHVLLYIRCNGLKDTDVLSKSDPIAQVALDGVVVGKTEIVANNLNPVFRTPIRFDYRFETLQRLRVDVLDADDKKAKTADFLAAYEGDVGSIVGRAGSSLTAPFTRGQGTITLTIEEIKQEHAGPPVGKTVTAAASVSSLVVAEMHGTRTTVKTTDTTIITASATGLDKKDWFGKSDPYMVISREIGGAMVEVCRTEIIKKTLAPQWKPIMLATETLGGAAAKGLKIEVWDWDAIGKNDLIGTATVTDILACPVDGSTSTEVGITIEKKGQRKPSGTVRFVVQRKVETETKTETCEYRVVANSPMAQDQKQYPALYSPISFLDAMKRGLQIQTVCCLDLTGSNGVMHDIKPPGNPNPYEVSMRAVGTVLQPYDADGQFLLYGYGAMIDGSKFPPFFTIDRDTAECQGGVEGMIEVYRQNRNRFSLGDMGSASGGDMNWRAHKHRYYCDDFYQVINHVSDLAEKDMMTIAPPGSSRMPSHYYIQFFVIDGDGFDKEGTCRALVRASALPISIVLVGVGKSSFPNLSGYDADDAPLRTSDGVTAVRDVVQFVKFDDFRNGDNVDMVRLAAEVLAEVPRQVESFIALYGITL